MPPEHITPGLAAEASEGPAPPLLLVVEDETLLALDLVDKLAAMGCAVLGPAATVRDAHDLLDSATPDAAVLDINLGGETVTPVAERLREMGLPYVLVTAYSPSADEPMALANVPRLTKPVRDLVLRQALTSILSRPP